MIVLQKGFTNEEYASYAVKANSEGKTLTILANGDVDLTSPPEPTLEELKVFYISGMKIKRDKEERGGFSYLDKRFDSDTISTQRISIAVLNALEALRVNDSTFSIPWTCADNTKVILNAEQLVGLSKALATHSGFLHEKYAQIKEAINLKETVEDVKSVCWETFTVTLG